MSNYRQTDLNLESEMRIESRLKRNELVSSEIKAFKALQDYGSENLNYLPRLLSEEMKRRREFLEILLQKF